MRRIEEATYKDISSESQALWQAQMAAHGQMTNMKRTLAHSAPAFHALMEWYPLRDAVREFLGDRTTTLFAHAVSSATGCLICSTFFRRTLIEAGENPDELSLSHREDLVVRYGLALSQNHGHGVDDALFQALATDLRPDQIVLLTSFGGLMLATNLINNALRVDLDEYLLKFRKSP